jgi:high-affinity iron transporter
MKLIAFVTFYLVLIAGCNDASQPQEIAAEKAPTEQTGENTYLMYCAQCHGASGDGMGLLKLDRPARSFIDSGFSFGNTVHAISKTTSSGIPGTPMPPFSDVLTKKQIEDVATYVRSFVKTIKEVSASETEMIVEERPLVARGMIPPINDACALHPRGLIIGNPDGFTILNN